MIVLGAENPADRSALVSGESILTYADFWRSVNMFAGLLHEFEKVRPGEFLPIVQQESGTQLVDVLAAVKMGAVPCPLNTRWTKSTIEMVCRRLNPRRREILETPVPPEMTTYFVLPFDGEDEGSYFESKDQGFSVEDGAVFALVHTSGSGGEPKAAALSVQNIFFAAQHASDALGLAQHDRWLLSLPLYHVGGLGIAIRCLCASATMALPESDESLADSIVRYSPTYVSLVATQLYRLLRDDNVADALARCKAVVMGGGPTPEGLVREATARGIKLVMSYGMTETAAMICCTRPGDPAERLLSSGRPLVDGTVSISSDGEILVRGEQLFLGYLQPDGALHRPLTEDGWFCTGDLGNFDEAGYLHVTGRRDNMFISGGENIQPEEIEAALREIEGVEEAIVVPVEDAEWGRRPFAFVRMREGEALDAAAIEKALRRSLPGYKVPKAIHAWPEEMGQTGIKPSRKEFENKAKQLATDLTD